MNVYDAMSALECLGYSFRLDENGEIKFRSPAEKPAESSALLDIARADRSSAADYIRRRESAQYSVMDALAIAQAVKKGDAVLLGPVVFHREPVKVTVLWEPVRGVADAVLEWHRERLETALCRRLKEMEQKDLDGMTEAEIDRLIEKYSYYKWLIEANEDASASFNAIIQRQINERKVLD